MVDIIGYIKRHIFSIKRGLALSQFCKKSFMLQGFLPQGICVLFFTAACLTDACFSFIIQHVFLICVFYVLWCSLVFCSDARPAKPREQWPGQYVYVNGVLKAVARLGGLGRVEVNESLIEKACTQPGLLGPNISFDSWEDTTGSFMDAILSCCDHKVQQGLLAGWEDRIAKHDSVEILRQMWLSSLQKNPTTPTPDEFLSVMQPLGFVQIMFIVDLLEMRKKGLHLSLPDSGPNCIDIGAGTIYLAWMGAVAGGVMDAIDPNGSFKINASAALAALLKKMRQQGFSNEQINELRKRITIQQIDAFEALTKCSNLHLVNISYVLQLMTKEEASRVMALLFTRMAPGGKIYITLPIEKDDQICRTVRPDDLAQELKAIGFDVTIFPPYRCYELIATKPAAAAAAATGGGFSSVVTKPPAACTATEASAA